MAQREIVRARVTRIDSAGAAWVTSPELGQGQEFGPCDVADGQTMVVGDQVLVAPVDAVADDVVIVGRVRQLAAAPAPPTPTVYQVAGSTPDIGEYTWVTLFRGDDGFWTWGPTPLETLEHLIAASGVSSSTKIVRANDSRLSNARTPTAHVHPASDVTSGTLDIARLPVAASGESSATKVVRADDSRLSASSSSNPTGPAGGSLSGTYPNPGIAAGAVGSAEVAAAIKDAAAATASLRTLGTGAQQAAAGNDPRLSDARTPTAHNHAASEVTSGTFSIARIPVAASGATSANAVVRADDSRLSDSRTPTAHSHVIADLPVAADGVSSSTALVRADDARLSNARTPVAHTHTKSQITDFAHTHAIADLPVATSGTSSATQVVRADDSRLSNARTPTAHTHAIADVTNLQTTLDGKASSSHTHAAADVTSGTFAIARIPTGTTSTTVALGNHTHDAAAVASGVLAIARIPTGTTGSTVALGNHTHTLSAVTAGGVLTPPLIQERIATPATPAANTQALYPKTDGRYYVVGPDGVERPLIPLPDQLHPNPHFDSVAASTVGPGGSTVTSRLMPTGWSWFWTGGSPPPTLVSDDTVTLEGLGRSVRIDFPVSGASVYQTLLSSIFAVTPGALVTVSSWVRGTAGPNAYIVIFTAEAGGTPDYFGALSSNSGSGSIIPGSTWQKITHSFVVPAGHTQARFVLRGGTTAGTLWWDATESSIIISPPASVIPGEIKMWPSAAAPEGYLLCDGSERAVADYRVLDALLGTTFGARTNGSGAAGTTHFRLPDFRGRSPLGVGTASPAVAGGTAHTLGQKGGEEKHTITIPELPDHYHATFTNVGATAFGTAGQGGYSFPSGGSAANLSGNAVNAANNVSAANTAHNVLDPFLGINFIIKT